MRMNATKNGTMTWSKYFVHFVFFLFIGVSIQGQDTESRNSELHRLFEEIGAFERAENPNRSFFRGRHPDKIHYKTIEDYKNSLDDYQSFLIRINSLDESQMTENDLISKETMTLKLEGEISQLKYKRYLIPFNAEGGFYNVLSRVFHRLPFKSEDDYRNYLKWLPTFSDYLNGHLDLLKIGINEKIVAPKVVIKNTVSLMEPWARKDFTASPLTSMFQSRSDDISKVEWETLQKEVRTIIRQKIWPAYEGILNFLKNEYLNASPEKPGILSIPNGKEYYQERVAYFTTLPLTPDEVFETGHREVKRIRELMEEIVKDVKFEGSFEEFLHFLRTDEQFYAKSPEELLSYAAWLSKKAEGALPGLFSHLYQLPFTIEPVPDDIAPTYTGGRYVQGNRNQDRPGIYWVNTYNLPARSLYNIPALTVHEAVPGHHLQIMIATELEDIPEFRNNFYISAFGEGWGLYSEYLGEEMGMYATPYDWFGRYTYEMWRACRLVVDVGLHYKGWTREQAVEFLSRNTALSLHEVNTEIDRYIGWPAQALSYKIGELTIKELRDMAVSQLGSRFDIKDFHYHILKNGSVPLPTLQRVIENWIKKVQNKKDRK